MMYGRYSTTLKNLMDNEQTAALLQKALSTYPIYEAKNPALYTIIPTREEINTKLLNHYKYREIGFETVGRFLDELEISMCEIMPYYNQLMSSEDMMNNIEDIFGNIDITEQYDEKTTGNSQASSEGSIQSDSENTSESSSENSSETSASSENHTEMNTVNTSKNISSETPGNELNITAANINNVSYADKAEWKKDDNTSSSDASDQSTAESKSNTKDTGKINTTASQSTETSNNMETEGTVSHTLTRKGNQGVNTYAHDMLEFSQLFLNIVQRIINDERIAELFMSVY